MTKIPFPIIIYFILAFTFAALGFLEFLLDSFSTAGHDVDDARILVLIYAIAAVCVLDEDGSITITTEERPA